MPERQRPSEQNGSSLGSKLLIFGVLAGGAYLLSKGNAEGSTHGGDQSGNTPSGSQPDGTQVFLLPGVSGANVHGPFHHYGKGGIPLNGTVPKETEGDAWGPYYNQRDARWGNMLLNGQPGFTMWKAGCYATALAMVEAHYGVMAHGHLVTPADIDTDRRNFDPGTPNMWAHISIPGHPEIVETIMDHPTKADFIHAVQQGHVVIMVLHHNPTASKPWETDHYLVVTGYEKLPNGDMDLIVRDTDEPDAKDVPLGEYSQIGDGWHISGGKDYHT